MNIEIIQANLSHLPAIQAFNQQLFELEFHNFDSSLNTNWTFGAEGTAYFTDMLNHHFVYLAVVDGEIAGYLAGRINVQGSYVTESLAEIDNMFINQNYRRYGVGSKLVETFKQACRQHNIKELKVTASAKNNNALNFYRKNGFNDFEITLKQKL